MGYLALDFGWVLWQGPRPQHLFPGKVPAQRPHMAAHRPLRQEGLSPGTAIILVCQDNGFQNRKWKPAAGCPRWQLRLNRSWDSQDSHSCAPTSLRKSIHTLSFTPEPQSPNLALSMGKQGPEDQHSLWSHTPPSQTGTPDFVPLRAPPLCSVLIGNQPPDGVEVSLVPCL